jgi:pimeloyl-ACP methyl ester carboxylesterase
MDRRWPDEAQSFADSVSGALRRIGGVDFTRRAEADPSVRRSELAPVLDQLGFHEVDVLGSSMDGAVAAAAAKAAGATAMPWPVASQLARLRLDGEDIPALYVVAQPPARLEHLDLFGSAIAVDLRTRVGKRVIAAGDIHRMPLDPFGVPCQPLSPHDGALLRTADLSRCVDAQIVLAAYYVLGALESVTEMTAAYAQERRQFGQPIGDFGAIQWRLSDIVVALDGLTEIAGFTLWRFCEFLATPADTVALRLATIEAANCVLSNSHQVHGAIGLCEEHDLAVIDRHLQPLLRRPGGVAATSRILRDEVVAHGFEGIFPIPSLKPRATEVAMPASISRVEGPEPAGR